MARGVKYGKFTCHILHPHAFYVGCKIWRYTGFDKKKTKCSRISVFRLANRFPVSFLQHNNCFMNRREVTTHSHNLLWKTKTIKSADP